MKQISIRSWCLAVLSAILQILPFPLAGPAPLWRRLFAWICLAPLLWALASRGRDESEHTARQSFSLAYMSGILWYLGNCYWIYQTMHTYAELPKAASWGVLLLFALYVGLYHGLFGLGFHIFRRRGPLYALLGTPFLWVAVEMARSRVTGFPWDLLGYTQVDNLFLSRLAPFAGVMALSFVVAAGNAAWVAWVGAAGRKSRVREKGAFATGAGLAMAIGIVSWLGTRSGSAALEAPTASAVLLQENLNVGSDNPAQHESKEELFRQFDALSLQPGDTARSTDPVSAISPPVALIAWPEAPAPFFDADPAFRQNMAGLARTARTPVLANDIALASRGADGFQYLYNSAAYFSAAGTYSGRYSKMHLVPFGEYTPYKPLFFFAGHLLGDLPFVPGTERTLFKTNGHQYGVFICYESIFGSDIRQLANDGADVLVNISDDGWYGDSSAPWEHLDMVRMRAIETGRWVLRAANTGITASIDPQGRVRESMPRHVRGSMLAGFAFHGERTLYARYGDWFGWLCVGVTVCAMGAAWASGRRTRPGLR